MKTLMETKVTLFSFVTLMIPEFISFVNRGVMSQILTLRFQKWQLIC